MSYFDHIFSISYDGKKQKTVRSGSFNPFLLHISTDSAYYQKRNVGYINEMNTTSGKISRIIQVKNTNYFDLVVVHSFLQPLGELKNHTNILDFHVMITYLREVNPSL